MIGQATQNILTKKSKLVTFIRSKTVMLNANDFDGIKLLFIKEKLNELTKKVDLLKQKKVKIKT